MKIVITAQGMNLDSEVDPRFGRAPYFLVYDLETEVCEAVRNMAEQRGADLILVDGPPGIGCPVTAVITGSSMVLAVTEPGVSGFHDLLRIQELVAHFQIPLAICVFPSPGLMRVRGLDPCRGLVLDLVPGRHQGRPPGHGRDLDPFRDRLACSHCRFLVPSKLPCHVLWQVLHSWVQFCPVQACPDSLKFLVLSVVDRPHDKPARHQFEWPVRERGPRPLWPWRTQECARPLLGRLPSTRRLPGGRVPPCRPGAGLRAHRDRGPFQPRSAMERLGV